LVMCEFMDTCVLPFGFVGMLYAFFIARRKINAILNE
jgi:hypothetical protein